ncbi:hypothetical protein F4861DRAFT_536951 [Xylaria intraflava]|nr:hypothetical protein F4861DRAFT_536951 [Xylaria intraflava]
MTVAKALPEDKANGGANGLQDIAVIGLSCRFGGDARDVGGFWDMLCSGRAAHTTKSRFDDEAGNADGNKYAGHYLNQDVYAFDAGFFGVPGKEARAMDPSQRLMLEVAYEAFESSGLTMDKIKGTNTSCYVGQFVSDYREMLFRDADSAPTYTVTGTGTSLISNRLSWFFDLKGPSFTINTACSSSMVALHEACESLRRRESCMSIVGGSNLILSPEMFTYLRNQRFLASDGKCKTFDASADGYGRGEGVAALVLMPVEEAVHRKYPVRAVIRGTGVNQNGKTKSIVMPSAEAQMTLIEKTYRSAGLDYTQTTYVETHGTGTQIGDRLELEAIGRTLGSRGQRGSHRKLVVGSSKPNIGHTEATAGLAGVIKGILALESGLIPPNIYFQVPNPSIPFDEWGVSVPTQLMAWPSESLRRMSACSTGYSGTNAHVVLDDAYHYLMQRGHVSAVHFTTSPARTTLPGRALVNGVGDSIIPQHRIFAVHAEDRDGVRRQCESLARYVERRINKKQIEPMFLRDLASTLNRNRSRLSWSACLLATSPSDLRSKLSAINTSDINKRVENPTLCFVFTGQGAQWAQMGHRLYGKYAVVRNSINSADKYLKHELGCPWSARDELFRDGASSQIDDPFFSQTLCTVLQVALVDLMRHWGVRPRYVVGHSSGEIAAAYCRGALSQEDAWKVAYFRGLLSSRMTQSFPDLEGAMIAAGLSESEALDLLQGVNDTTKGAAGQQPSHVAVVACVNSPNSVTLSGDASAIVLVERKLTERRKFVRRLQVRNAYHSPHMEYIAADYVHAIRDICPRDDEDSENDCTMFSSVTGGPIEPWELGPVSWMKNLVSTVRFSDAVGSMLASEEIHAFVEIGPRAALRGPLKQIVSSIDNRAIPYTSLLANEKDDAEVAMTAAGFLYNIGVAIDLGRVNNEQEAGMLIDLPPHAWNHGQRYTSLSRVQAHHQVAEQLHSGTSLLGKQCPSMGEHEHKWRRFLNLSELPWLRDHEIDSTLIFPAAGYIVLAIEAAQSAADAGKKVAAFRFRDITISAALVVPDDGDVEIVVDLRPRFTATRSRNASTVWMDFSICSCVDGSELRENCNGMLSLEYEMSPESPMTLERKLALETLKVAYTGDKQLCLQQHDSEKFYALLSSFGLCYGPAFARVTEILEGDAKACCTVATQSWDGEGNDEFRKPHVIHPGTIDAMLHAIFAAARAQVGLLTGAMVPTFIEEIIISADACKGRNIIYTGVAMAKKHGMGEMIGNVNMHDASTLEPLVQLRGVQLRATNSSNASLSAENHVRAICSSIRWVPAPTMTDGSLKGEEIVLLHAARRSSFAVNLCGRIVEDLSARGVRARPMAWSTEIQSGAFQGIKCISLVEIDEAVLAEARPEDFGTLQAAVTSSNSMTWVSRDDATGSIVPGASRSIRNEIPSISLRTLQLSLKSLKKSEYDTLTKTILLVADSTTDDNEFREQDGHVLVPRLVEDSQMNTLVSNIANDRDGMEHCQLGGGGTVVPADLSILIPGNLSSFYVKPRKQEEINTSLGDDEVEIQVMASGVNFRDVMVAMGVIRDSTFGFEASGIVTAIGSHVKRFKIGDRVVSLCHGGHCTVLRNKEALTQHVPADMSFEIASTLPLVYVTAYNALVRVAGARRGQSVLIHAAAGGVGQAAIQLSQHLGLRVYATVGSEDKRSLLRETYGLQEDQILFSRDTSFGAAIRRMTGGRGVDIVLNSLAGESLRESWHCIAPFGTFVEIGLKDIQQNSGLDMRPFLQDATFSFFNVSRMMTEATDIVRQLLDETFALLHKGVLKPLAPLTIVPVSEIEKGFRTMQTGRLLGKMALSWASEQRVPMMVKCRSKLNLRPDATYVLVGGFGGLGRSIAGFLASAGAKNICFVSRSGASSSDAQSLLNNLQARGVNAWAYKCDVADKSSLEPLHKACAQAPIRGVIQCAMVLQDIMFEKMSAEQWRTSLRPKVQGTACLDRLTASISPSACDFFIVLSSFAGIFGNPTQANYAAACAFQDALMHERMARGQHAVTIDVGIMRDVGYLAEHGARGHLREWEVPFGLREDELHALLQVAIVEEAGPQIVTGFPTGQMLRESGIENPVFLRDPKFSILTQTGLDSGFLDQVEGAETGAGDKAKRDVSRDMREALARSASREEAHRLIVEGMRARVARLLQIDVADIEVKRPMHSYGVDSLVAVELRTWLFQELKANVSIFDLTATMPMESLGLLVLKRSDAVPEAFKA